LSGIIFAGPAALQEIAERQHGLISAKDALDILVTAGVYESRDRARATVYSTFHKSKHFIKERPGVYRLVKPMKPLSLALTS
jgi:hypothetical protein